MNLPRTSATVTFLFSDIEGSTKLAQKYPDQWESLRERHHTMLHSAMSAHNGHVFQIIGDAFCVAFPTAIEAVKAAADAQRLLQQEAWSPAPIKVRMGINTGTARVTADIDRSGGYKGYIAMARVQRLMSAAHGGQVLISSATEALVHDELPENIALRDMGERRLNDLFRPEHIYQLIISNLNADFPPIKTLEAYRHNLPIQMTSFIGREKELAEIKQAIGEHRLVTLTGAGGSGKTRLALQVAADLLNPFPDGIWLVELAPLTEPDFIPQTILSAFSLKEQEGRTSTQTLLDFLHERNLLLIIDNCEHLIEASAHLVNRLLHHAPRIKIIITSREALGVEGELIWQVPTLSLPDVKHGSAPERILQYEAIQLFFDRAVLVQPHFTLTEGNAPAIAQICQRLDGIPLAIELAAARVKTLGVNEIMQRLDDRFRLLTGGARTALPRQQTLRATISWSYDLLSPPEQDLSQRLSVFAGGWTLDAAEQVYDNMESELETLEWMINLVEKSVVNLHESAGEARYRMLETTRQYCLERLRESGRDEEAQNEHLSYFLQLAENAENQLHGPEQTFWLNRLESEHDNLRAAMGWSMQAGKGEEAVRIAGALGWFWFKHSHFSEGRSWLGKILEAHQSTSEQAQVKAWRSAGLLARWQRDTVEACRIFTRNMGREQALGDQAGVAFSLHMLGNVAELEGDVEKGRELHKKSIAICREIEATWLLAMALVGLGYLEHTEGNLALAEDLYDESLMYLQRLGDKWGMELIFTNLGYLRFARGDILDAKKIFQENLGRARQLGDKDGMLTIFAGLACVFQHEGLYIPSARLQGVVVANGKEYGTSLYPVEQQLFDSTVKALQETMGAKAYHIEFETGMTLTTDEAVDIVSGLIGREQPDLQRYLPSHQESYD